MFSFDRADCWTATGTSFNDCCLRATPPSSCFEGFDKWAISTCCDPLLNEDVAQWLARSACATRPHVPSLEARQSELEALVKLLQPQAEDRANRWLSTSVRFKLALVSILSSRNAHRRVALELGVGNSATTVLLSALFCKLITVDGQPTWLMHSASQGLPNVFHVQLDLTKDSWRTFSESEMIDFVFIDAVHTYTGVRRDVINALTVLQHAEKPMIAFHDYNLPGVMGVVTQYQLLGALHSCEAIGEVFAAEEIFSERLVNVDPHYPADLQIPGPFYEGVICEVDAKAATTLLQDVQIQHNSVWQVYRQIGDVLPYGSMQMFPGAADSYGTLIITAQGQNAPWFGTWSSNMSIVDISIETQNGRQKGTLHFSKTRQSFLATIKRPVASNDTNLRRRERWADLSPFEAYGPRAVRFRSTGLRIFRGLLPETELYGLATSVIDREFVDVNFQPLVFKRTRLENVLSQ